MTISRRFFAVLAVMTPLCVVASLVVLSALSSMKTELGQILGDNVSVTRASTTVGIDLARAETLALRLVTATRLSTRRALNAALDQSIVPKVDAELSQLGALQARVTGLEPIRVGELARGWAQFLDLRSTGVLGTQAPVEGLSGISRLTSRIGDIFGPLTTATQGEVRRAVNQAELVSVRANQTYATTRVAIVASTFGALGIAIGGVLLLTRSVVPRIRRYSRFASAVARGDLSKRLAPRGGDELATLGRALDEMVERREFVEALQVVESEKGAHGLLKRQIERSIATSHVVILSRNNSDDRLEPITALAQDSALMASLEDAKPASCLAVRYARPHSESPEHEPLTRCEVCGLSGRRTTCEPLLVGGEVIGSVLVEHGAPLRDREATALHESVAQAAPVLANLHGLALAELRASTDGLTGLPNKPAVKDTIKRLAAQSSRSLGPLSAVALDLDNFKQINDNFGHGRGDDFLAAVGAALADTLRDSDFVGRNGGEEFLVLLPETDATGAMVVAEKIRLAIESIRLPGIDCQITVSQGVASLPEHANDGDQLIRSADRALYTAKTNGRNRTELAVPHGMPSRQRSVLVS